MNARDLHRVSERVTTGCLAHFDGMGSATSVKALWRALGASRGELRAGIIIIAAPRVASAESFFRVPADFVSAPPISVPLVNRRVCQIVVKLQRRANVGEDQDQLQHSTPGDALVQTAAQNEGGVAEGKHLERQHRRDRGRASNHGAPSPSSTSPCFPRRPQPKHLGAADAASHPSVRRTTADIRCSLRRGSI